MSLLHTIRGLADTGRISVPTVLDALLGRGSLERCDARLGAWSKKLLRDAEVKLVVRGREHAAGDEPLVVMSNHQSLYDVPVLFQAIPGRLRMVAKKELFRVPVWGRAMLEAGFVRIDRQDRERAIRSIDEARAMLSAGTRIWISPEGTRSATGALGPFKSGGFHLAIDAGLPILPVVIDGTRKILPARGTVVRTGHEVTVTLLPRIDSAAYGREGRKRLAAAVRQAIEDVLVPRARPLAADATAAPC